MVMFHFSRHNPAAPFPPQTLEQWLSFALANIIIIGVVFLVGLLINRFIPGGEDTADLYAGLSWTDDE